ncbi:MAG: hypothetical protein J6Z41_01740 [Prevotella sp.]|nr:hypothetical protein [Prevotella sp.]
MAIVLICIGALITLGIATALLSRLRHDDNTVVLPNKDDCATCDGANDKCNATCLLEAAVNKPEYFDDEELDRFAGREAVSYTEEETEEFREILYTMREDEVPRWLRSLTVRDIQIPASLKSEVMLFV